MCVCRVMADRASFTHQLGEARMHSETLTDLFNQHTTDWVHTIDTLESQLRWAMNEVNTFNSSPSPLKLAPRLPLAQHPVPSAVHTFDARTLRPVSPTRVIDTIKTDQAQLNQSSSDLRSTLGYGSR